MKIALVAGEPSGDFLGGGLIEALSQACPDAEFEGVGGEHMTAAGLRSLYPLESLSVMGVVEVIAHLPRLLRIRKTLRQRWLANPPDLFIGIDAPDFNLGISRVLKAANIPTVQYVSPTVWAWRQKRIHALRKAVDRVLCIYPFERDFFDQQKIDAVYVGHPLADVIPLTPDHKAARQSLGYDSTDQLLALLPGSRRSEVDRLLPVFCETARRVKTQCPAMQFVLPAATPALKAYIQQKLAAIGRDDITVINGNARTALAAADAALVASGTATLEAMLSKCPAVMAYQVNRLTAMLARRSLTISFFAMPNLMAGEMIMPEFIQDQVSADHITPAIMRLLEDPGSRAKVTVRFAELHERLRQDASHRAAEAALGLVQSRDVG